MNLDSNYQTMTAHGTDHYATRRRLSVPNRPQALPNREVHNDREPMGRRNDDRSGHDRVLRALLAQGVTVEIVMSSGVAHRGVLRGRDAFTVTMECSDNRTRLLFKHAIDEIVLPPKEGNQQADRDANDQTQ